jgi:glutamate-1-semialdehyde 2,1-aminomutase
MDVVALGTMSAAATVALVGPVRARVQLSRAKHASLAGHPRIAKALASLVPFYEYDERRFFDSDGAPGDVAERRRNGFHALAARLRARAPETIRLSEELAAGVSDLQFTSRYRVPFQYARYVRQHLKTGVLVTESAGVRLRDLDGNDAYDLSGSYGLNVFGYDFYKACIEAGIGRVRELGPVLGAYHPVIVDIVRRLKEISGLDEASFHMSGTEAVMQAVRLARYHTRRSHLVRFAGAYHGWWDAVQPGVGTPGRVRDTYTLREMDEATLRVLRSRRDIACVLVNPLQALHPNSAAPSDGSLVNSERHAHFDRSAYTRWLHDLRAVCTERGIALILDEVFVGFRLAYGGAQEYFGVRADLVTYGKTLGGGLPVGVLCGKAHLMRRFREDRPTDICFARGTFNSHPYVLGAMQVFLEQVSRPDVREAYAALDDTWNARAQDLNARFEAAELPLRVVNLSSIWTIRYTQPSRYNWMLQYYLRAQGLVLSWVGSGRLIFSHSYSDADFAVVADRIVAAATAMREDGWWWQAPALSDKGIRRRVLREILAVKLGRA